MRSTVLIDEKFAVGMSYGASGTPSVVLIDTNGKIASGILIGDLLGGGNELQRPHAVAMATAGRLELFRVVSLAFSRQFDLVNPDKITRVPLTTDRDGKTGRSRENLSSYARSTVEAYSKPRLLHDDNDGIQKKSENVAHAEDDIRLRKLKNSGRLRNSPPTAQIF